MMNNNNNNNRGGGGRYPPGIGAGRGAINPNPNFQSRPGYQQPQYVQRGAYSHQQQQFQQATSQPPRQYHQQQHQQQWLPRPQISSGNSNGGGEGDAVVEVEKTVLSDTKFVLLSLCQFYISLS